MPALIVLGIPEEILAAVMAILLIVGALLIARLIANLLPDIHIPLVGSLRGLVNSATSSVISGAQSAWELAGDGAYWLIVAPVVFTYHLISGGINLAENIGWKLATIIRVTIPGTLTVAMQFAQSVEDTVKSLFAAGLALAAQQLANAQAALTSLISEIHAGLSADIINLDNTLTNAISAVDGTLSAAITTSLGEAYAFTTRVEATVEGDLHALASVVTADVLAVEHLAVAEIGQALSAAEAFAVTAAGVAAHDAVTALDAVTETSVAAVWQGVITDVDNVITAAEQDFADVVTDLQSVARAVPADIAGAITATLALSIPMLKLAERCVIPNCRNLSGLGQFLADLFTDATDLALVALFTELATNPTSGAQDVFDTLGTLANDTLGLGKTLVGV